jgi:enoyl-CoA hydratase
MGAFSTVAVEGGALTITMDDGKVNALSHEMFGELNAALDDAERDGHAVVLSGRDGIFSAGFNLKQLREMPGGADLVRKGFELSARMLSFPRPIVAVCTGHALAMASFLLLSVDYRIGVDGDFKIGANEVAIGMTMPDTAIEITRQRVPEPYFGRVINNAEMFSPTQAVAPGFLDRVVPASERATATQEVIDEMLKLDPRAHSATKLRTRKVALSSIRACIETDDAALRASAGGLFEKG